MNDSGFIGNQLSEHENVVCVVFLIINRLLFSFVVSMTSAVVLKGYCFVLLTNLFHVFLTPSISMSSCFRGVFKMYEVQH